MTGSSNLGPMVSILFALREVGITGASSFSYGGATMRELLISSEVSGRYRKIVDVDVNETFENVHQHCKLEQEKN